MSFTALLTCYRGVYALTLNGVCIATITQGKLERRVFNYPTGVQAVTPRHIPGFTGNILHTVKLVCEHFNRFPIQVDDHSRLFIQDGEQVACYLNGRPVVLEEVTGNIVLTEFLGLAAVMQEEADEEQQGPAEHCVVLFDQAMPIILTCISMESEYITGVDLRGDRLRFRVLEDMRPTLTAVRCTRI